MRWGGGRGEGEGGREDVARRVIGRECKNLLNPRDIFFDPLGRQEFGVVVGRGRHLNVLGPSSSPIRSPNRSIMRATRAPYRIAAKASGHEAVSGTGSNC